MNAEIVLAQGRAYSLFGYLFRKGLDERVYNTLSQWPELSASIESLGETAEERIEAGKEKYYQLFERDVFPFASVFLSFDPRPGGPLTSEVLDRFQRIGFSHDLTAESADHIGWILSALAFLSGAEIDALRDEKREVVGQLRELQANYLDQIVLPWVGSFAEAVLNLDEGFFGTATQMMLELVAYHRQALQEAGYQRTYREAQTFDSLSKLLEEEKTDLRAISKYLLVPHKCGLLLTRSDISQLSRKYRLPRGFGARSLELESLFHTAADHQLIGQLCEALVLRFEKALHFHQALGAHQDPTIQDKLQQTILGLKTMASAQI